MLEHSDEVEPDLRLIAISVAGGEQRHFTASHSRRLRGDGGLTAPGELLAQGVGPVWRHRRLRMHPQRGVQKLASHRTAVDGVDRFGDDGNARQFADHVRGTQHLVAPPRAATAVFDGLGAQHQVREVDVPRMRRHIRTFGHVTHVTEVALVDHLPKGLFIHAIDLAGLRIVDQIEQSRKGIAQIETAAAAMADVEYPFEFFLQRTGVIELGILLPKRMARGRFQIALAEIALAA